jgi:hypothetical protein
MNVNVNYVEKEENKKKRKGTEKEIKNRYSFRSNYQSFTTE